MRPLVVGVFGPTGVGKTAVGMAVAEALGVRIISCDSLQLYRGLPVLTNQPAQEELARVPHEMVAVAEPWEEWSAARYADAVRRLIEEDLARRGVALLVGGTGLYLRAALAPLAAAPPADEALRAELEAIAEAEGTEALHRRLASLDPEAAAAIHPNNVRRVVRALEGLELTRRAGSQHPRWSGRSDLWSPEYYHPTAIFGLTMDRGALHDRIHRRTEEMLAGGAIDEVRAVLKAHPEGVERGVGKAIGFREIECYLAGQTSLIECRDRLQTATRAYARRQHTWMRKMKDVVMIDASRFSADEIAVSILKATGGC